MPAAAAAQELSGDAAVELRYLDPAAKGNAEAAHSRKEAGGARGDSTGVAVTIRDGRTRLEQRLPPMSQLDSTGFGYARLSASEREGLASFDPFEVEHDEALRTQYKNIVARAVQRLTGAAWARATTVVLRRSSVVGVHTLPSGDNAPRGPVNDVHCDFTPEARAIGLFEQLGDEVGLGGCRWQVINVWRNVASDPVAQWPMAVCDASSVAPADLVARVSPENGNTIYNVVHNPRHRWFSYPGLTSDEMLLFKQYDSDATALRFTPHTAFAHPRSRPEAPIRQSCEARVLCFFDPERQRGGALRKLAAYGKGAVDPTYTAAPSARL
eukprot:CAMPEP_0182917836 /NCGR_PEP_ID=MMETSP0105_2-20130417/1733_1 /TAXON_ID=81532 ORGANISM="Acanthoeca-like sp., Strain 10tr" /NCGR_SAMPLE_ID=MMETSP0105_2 /ASSEMBLY_ACC=CAM_ASM_000205 /LENGTH=325 /DNA_ID=CAMNT_0025054855 /DNA_START=6 /DNA_END=983 /DNA_ORIENTATION=+